MKLQILSDLHSEFFPTDLALDNVYSEWSEPKDDVDAVVLAGDIGSFVDGGVSLLETLDRFCSDYKEVIYLAGNHEFYGAKSTQEVITTIERFEDSCSSFKFLNNSSFYPAEKGSIRGATLWFPHPTGENYNRSPTNDFRYIPDFEPWVYRENALSRFFLQNRVGADNIVVTHYLPHPEAIHPTYKNDPLNDFFMCDMSKLIEEKKPKLWIFGHTHSSIDRVLPCGTRLLCNPYGYYNREVNPEFKTTIVEV